MRRVCHLLRSLAAATAGLLLASPVLAAGAPLRIVTSIPPLASVQIALLKNTTLAGAFDHEAVLALEAEGKPPVT